MYSYSTTGTRTDAAEQGNVFDTTGVNAAVQVLPLIDCTLIIAFVQKRKTQYFHGVIVYSDCMSLVQHNGCSYCCCRGNECI